MSNASAYVVEIAGETAGLAVAEGKGFRFFASSRQAYALDGRRFGSLAGVNAAVARLLAGPSARRIAASPPSRPPEVERSLEDLDRAAA